MEADYYCDYLLELKLGAWNNLNFFYCIIDEKGSGYLVSATGAQFNLDVMLATLEMMLLRPMYMSSPDMTKETFQVEVVLSGLILMKQPPRESCST